MTTNRQHCHEYTGSPLLAEPLDRFHPLHLAHHRLLDPASSRERARSSAQ
jgi:hypothetical protein